MELETDLSEELLPEDDSIFHELSSRVDNYSSDALLETSHDSLTSYDAFEASTSSTPVHSRSRRKNNQESEREAPSSPGATQTENSPTRRVTRSQSPKIFKTPPPKTAASSRITRSRSPSISDSVSRRITRSQSPSVSNLTDSNSNVLKRKTRSQSPSVANPSEVNESISRRTRSQSPTASRLSVRASQRNSQSAEKPSGSQPAKKAKKTSDNGRIKCPKCPNTLANKKTLDTHLRGHLMAGVTSRLPSVPLLSQDMPSLLKSVLEDLLKQTVIGETDLKLNKYTQLVLNSIDDDVTGVLSELCSVLSGSFYDIMKKKKILFPSALRSNLYLGTNQLLASVDFRKSVSEKFEELSEVESEILNVFVGNVIFSLSKKVLVHCLKVMRGSTENEIEVRMKRSGDRVESRDFQELVYYIGGYIVAGYIWKGKGYSANSTTWASFTNVLKQNFRCDRDGQKQCSETVRHFTEERDRGGLTHITNAAFDFFLVTFDVIMQQEGEDGSLPPNIIDEKLLVDDLVLLLWDVAVASELSSDESLDLLIQILTSCVKTVMKGIMNRRLNEELKQSYVSIPLRSKLAGGTSASKSNK